MSHTEKCWTDTPLAYAKLGWHLVPFHSIIPGRGPTHPCTCGGNACPGHRWEGDVQELASNSPAVIRSWADEDRGGHPAGSVGVLLGARSETVGLLASKNEGGWEELEQLEKEYGELPTTLKMSFSYAEKIVYFFHWPCDTPDEEISLAPGVRLLGTGYVQRLPDELVPVRKRTHGHYWRVHPGRDRPLVLPPWVREQAGLQLRGGGSEVAMNAEPSTSVNSTSVNSTSVNSTSVNSTGVNSTGVNHDLNSTQATQHAAEHIVSREPEQGSVPERRPRPSLVRGQRSSSNSRGRHEPIGREFSDPLSDDPLPFRMHRPEEVLQQKGMQWRLRPWLAERALTVLTGPTHTAGKTTFLLHMMSALRGETPFLGIDAASTDVAFITDMEPHFFGEAASRAGLHRKRSLDGLSVLHEGDIPAYSLDRLGRAVQQHCSTYGVHSLFVDPVCLLERRSSVQGRDALTEVAQMLRWLARSGLSVCVSVPTAQEATLPEALDDLGPLAKAADTVVHIERTRQDRPVYLGRPDLFEGERMLKGRRRILTSVSRFDCVPSRALIRLGPDGYEYIYDKKRTQLEDAGLESHDRDPQLPARRMALGT